MKKTLLFGSLMVILIACGGVKKTQEALNTGNYTQAMHKAIKNLSENKTKKGNQPYILLLEEAFAKYTARELEHITFLQKEGNPANYEFIYKGYNQIKEMHERIRPLLPLWVQEENRNASFNFRNYDEEILVAQDQLSEYLYDNANTLLKNGKFKTDFRQAYNDFNYLLEINPGYADAREKMEEAWQLGQDFVKVNVLNDTDQVIPQRLEEELLNFNTYGLNDLWTQYHTTPLKDIRYDYEMQVAFRDINISPEQVRETQIIKEKQIKDGFKYLHDEEGNIVKDSLGNEIKVDNFRTVRCNFYQFTQHKAAMVTGLVSYIDLNTKQQVNTYPLSSEFIFEHVYANYQGDRRALESDLIALLDLRAVPFPSNEQMVYDAGEDLKLRLKDILVRHRFN